MRLRNMLKICLVFWKSEPQYAYKRYAYKKNMYCIEISNIRLAEDCAVPSLLKTIHLSDYGNISGNPVNSSAPVYLAPESIFMGIHL